MFWILMYHRHKLLDLIKPLYRHTKMYLYVDFVEWSDVSTHSVCRNNLIANRRLGLFYFIFYFLTVRIWIIQRRITERWKIWKREDVMYSSISICAVKIEDTRTEDAPTEIWTAYFPNKNVEHYRHVNYFYGLLLLCSEIICELLATNVAHIIWTFWNKRSVLHIWGIY
jgi:hypothetical protein